MGDLSFLQILTVVFALSVATTVFNKRVLNIPSAIGVPIVSAIFVFLLQWAVGIFGRNDFIYINIDEIENAVRSINFYDFLINGVICFILTSSALKFKISDLKKHWRPISILATISLFFCAFLFAVLIFGYQAVTNNHLPILIVLLLGAALGATDPIGIKGVLNSVKAPHHLMVKLEGESLFNDAMCIALFMTVLNVIKGGDITLLEVITNLFYEVSIAIIIGLFFGLAILRLLKGKHEIESLILSTALLASGSYLIALYAHASAPIACVIGGLVVGNQWKNKLEKHEISEVNHFWHTVEGIINSFLFTLIGLELFIIPLDIKILIGGVIAFILLHFSRFIANYLSFILFPKIKKKSYNGSLTILSWGGVRGGISLALVLSVTNIPQILPYASILIGYTFICVLLSGLVCGLGLPYVMNAFYHNPNEPKTGLAGWYQKLCHRLNKTGVQYTVEEDREGNEYLTVFNTTTIAVAASDPENEITISPIEIANEVKRLEDPDNF